MSVSTIIDSGTVLMTRGSIMQSILDLFSTFAGWQRVYGFLNLFLPIPTAAAAAAVWGFVEMARTQMLVVGKAIAKLIGI